MFASPANGAATLLGTTTAMRYVFGRRYAYATLCNHLENHSYTAVIRWNITRVVDRYSDGIKDGDWLPSGEAGEFLFDITNAMPIRPAADCILGNGELDTCGFTSPTATDKDDYSDAHMAQYAKAHNFDCMVEYVTPYEGMTMTRHYKATGHCGYEALYTFKPGV